MAPLPRFEVPDIGSLRGNLEALVETIVALLAIRPAADVAVAALSAAAHSPELAGHARAFFADRLVREQPVFVRAASRGELPVGTDPTLLMDLLAGAVWVRVVLRQTPVEPDFARRAVALVLDGIGRGCRVARPMALSSSTSTCAASVPWVSNVSRTANCYGWTSRMTHQPPHDGYE